jgi:hypothetical protein
LNIDFGVNERQDCKIGTVCVGSCGKGVNGGDEDERKMKIEGFHVDKGNITMKPLVIA